MQYMQENLMTHELVLFLKEGLVSEDMAWPDKDDDRNENDKDDASTKIAG